jgi:hypothetical protein
MAKEGVSGTQKLQQQTNSHADADEIPRISERTANNYKKGDLKKKKNIALCSVYMYYNSLVHVISE